jgi:hypothetical protein
VQIRLQCGACAIHSLVASGIADKIENDTL